MIGGTHDAVALTIRQLSLQSQPHRTPERLLQTSTSCG